MRAKIMKIDPDRIDAAAIAQAGEILLHGGLVAFPTETVYGLGGNALDAGASARIYEAKGRPSDNPLIVHIADWDALSRIAAQIPPRAGKLADAYWPGPLTMIFPKKNVVPPETTGGLDSVAVRLPSHPVARALIRAAGGYVAAPSANRSGRPSPTTAAHVAQDLGDEIDLILDGGMVGIGIESTIVDFTEEVPTILRPGYISEEMLISCLGEVRTDQALIDADSALPPKAPGMKYRHYAPRADLTIVEGEQSAVVAKINDLAAEAAAKGKSVGIIAARETADAYPLGLVKTIGSRAREEDIARNLYEILRAFDETQVQLIYSEAFYTPRMGQAIMNRLLKAAGHQVLHI